MAKHVSRQRYRFTEAGTYYIDLWRSMSAQERKLFRQGQVAHVMGGLLKDSDDDTVVEINVAPDTWVTRTAWRRGKAIYDAMVTRALEGTGRVKGKYHDYRVYLNNAMGAGTVLPVDAANNTIPSGEWGWSEHHSEDVDWSDAQIGTPGYINRQADSFYVQLCGEHIGTGGNWVRVGLIQSWIQSRALPDSDDPDLPPQIATDPLVNLFDSADNVDEIIASLDSIGDRPPYDVDEHFGYFAGQTGSEAGLQRVAFSATQAGAGQIAAINGFSAICGLVEVKVSHKAAGNNVCEILLDVSMKGGKI